MRFQHGFLESTERLCDLHDLLVNFPCPVTLLKRAAQTHIPTL